MSIKINFFMIKFLYKYWKIYLFLDKIRQYGKVQVSTTTDLRND